MGNVAKIEIVFLWKSALHSEEETKKSLKIPPNRANFEKGNKPMHVTLRKSAQPEPQIFCNSYFQVAGYQNKPWYFIPQPEKKSLISEAVTWAVTYNEGCSGLDFLILKHNSVACLFYFLLCPVHFSFEKKNMAVFIFIKVLFLIIFFVWSLCIQLCELF